MEMLQLVIALLKIRPRLQPLMPPDNGEDVIEDMYCNSWGEFQDGLDGWNKCISDIQRGYDLEHMNTNRSFTENLDKVLCALGGKVRISCFLG